MEWTINRQRHKKEVEKLRKGDKIILRDDIYDHRDEINCGYVKDFKKFTGKEVTIKCIYHDTKNNYAEFKIKEDDMEWTYDSDMIDFEKTRGNEPSLELLSWLVNR